MKVLEIGGGNNADYYGGKQPNGDEYTNVDVRKVDNVDVVHDFNQPFPFKDGEFDKIVSRYCLEHINWQRLSPFVKEMYRVLKPAGKVYIVTANLEAQSLIIARELPHTDGSQLSIQNTVGMIFGQHDYDENSHAGSINPILANTLFRNAGFTWVKVYDYWQWGGDMVVEAKK